ncbi:MAG TPA: MFS transporter [Gaiellaceae bacterium]|nr:MFS transporter [Gaiellaceae bacterium]
MKQRLVTPENKKWWTLAAVSVGLFVIMLDNTVVNVALPSMRQSLHMTLSELEWVVAGYALTFAAFMLTGGKLADYLGRRLVFMAGLAVFTGASLACGLAPNGGFLIGARVVQGLGGALMNPATLSIITATFPARERGKAIGIWAGVSAMALAIGPLVGGLLTEHVNWNWIFFINVPIGVAGLFFIPVFVDESRDTSHEQRLDLPGLLTSAVGLFALTYAFIEANGYGWTSGRILAAFAVAVVSLVAFILFERHQRIPMLDLSLFRNRTFGGANGAMLFVGLAMFGTFFYVSLYVQNVLGWSPVEAGASFLPMTFLIIALAPRTGALADSVGSRWLVGGGMLLLAVMLFYYGFLGADSSFWTLLPALLIGGIGMAMTMTPTTAAAMSAVAVDKAGVGSAVLNSARQVGGSLGIAVMGAIVASTTSSSLRQGETRQIAFLHGFHDALRVGSFLLLAGAAIAVLAIRKIDHPHQEHATLAEPA